MYEFCARGYPHIRVHETMYFTSVAVICASETLLAIVHRFAASRIDSEINGSEVISRDEHAF